MNNIFSNQNLSNPFLPSNSVNSSVYATIHTTIGTEFCKLYYNKMAGGVNCVLELFNPNVSCSLAGNDVFGSYNLLTWYTNQGIHHFEYNKISGISIPINNNEIMVSVHGFFKGVGLWNQISSWTRFNEIFILENIGNNKFCVKNYIVRTIS